MATILDGVSVPDDGTKAVTFKTDQDLSSWQYKPVYLAADRKVQKQTTAGGAMLGILQNAPDGSSTDADALVKCGGFSYAYAGGTCTVNGLGTIATTTGDFVDETGTNKEAPVRFVEGTTTDGDLIVVQIVHQHKE